MINLKKITFFVATNGNDKWSGKIPTPNAKKSDGPFATLVRARNAVREIKAKNALKEPITIMVREGKYYLNETFVLSYVDSGTSDCSITYTAYPGEKPVISGGKKVTGWKAYKGKILQAELPEAKGGKWKFRQLFYNGKRQIRARYPNFDSKNPFYGGWAFIEGPADEGGTSGLKVNGFAFSEKSLAGCKATAFKYKKGTFKNHWEKPTEGEINIFAGLGWSNDIIPIKSVDEKKRTIILKYEIGQFDKPPWYIVIGFYPNNRFIVENLLEELDQPGEWCFDSEDGILYFWPPQDLTKSDEVVIPALDCLIELAGTSWINISGFTFTETTDGDNLHHNVCEGYGAMFPRDGLKYCGDTIHLKSVEHCIIENNHFYAVGGNAIYLDAYNARNIIQGNEIDYAGANGICLLGDKKYHPMFNHVLDNKIHHCGVINKYVAGVFLGLSEGNVVGHNYIHHMSHHGINLGNSGFGRNIVEYNEIRYTCLETHDTGAINCWMEDPVSMLEKDAERSGHIIRYNLIADTLGCRLDKKGKFIVPDKGTFGIYTDNAASNCFVYGNIILRSAYGMTVHNGKNNIIENNIIVDCKYGIRYCDYISIFAPQMAGFLTGNSFCRNIICFPTSESFLFLLHRWTDKVLAQSDYNLFFNVSDKKYVLGNCTKTGVKQISISEWQKMGYDRNSMIADPLFVNPKNDNFRLKPKSPAFKLGFQQIDITKIGIRKK